MYRPGSAVNFTFFNEHVAIYVAQLIIVGDVNVHLDVLSASSTSTFSDILAGAGLVQYVSGPVQRAGHTLDVINTQNALEVCIYRRLLNRLSCLTIP